jgi:alpha-mannosidase
MRARQLTTTSTGPAFGEIVSEGFLLDEQGQELAQFRQRFRAWLSRPMLDLHIELTPLSPPADYPWHSCYGARFAWRDESATLLRGTFGTASPTSHTRPETPDFLEVRIGRQNAVIFPGGLPFHQRHGTRMVDVLLITPGETCRTFDLGISLDREHPMQTALGVVSPAPVVSLNQGPPHVGATGWLFHLDAPNLLLTTLRPADDPPGISARLLETSGFGGPAELRCVRDPQRAVVLDAHGSVVMDATTQGDAVQLEVSANDLVQLRVEFA